jgi:hypothetical protein
MSARTRELERAPWTSLEPGVEPMTRRPLEQRGRCSSRAGWFRTSWGWEPSNSVPRRTPTRRSERPSADRSAGAPLTDQKDNGCRRSPRATSGLDGPTYAPSRPSSPACPRSTRSPPHCDSYSSTIRVARSRTSAGYRPRLAISPILSRSRASKKPGAVQCRSSSTSSTVLDPVRIRVSLILSGDNLG